MTRLASMAREGASLVTDAFLAGNRNLTEDDLAPYLTQTDVDVDLGALRDAFGEAIEQHEQGDEAMEARLAPKVHRLMPMTRRQASDLGMWQYLAIVHFDDFVRHRWDPDEDTMREKFLGEGPTNIYSQALNRLWWIPELTYDPAANDYGFTERIFSSRAPQTLINQVFDRWFSRYRPLANACAQVLIDEDAPDPLIRRTTTRLRQALSDIQAESLHRGQARSLVRRVHETVVSDRGGV